MGSPASVLIVEDEWLIADSLQHVCETAGYVVCGPAARVPEALALVASAPPDVAVLDVSLRGERSFPIARALTDKAVPFIFMTGYVSIDIPEEFRGAPLLNKPIDEARLLKCIRSVLSVQ